MKKLTNKVVAAIAGLGIIIGSFALNLNFKQALTNFCCASYGGGLSN